MPAATPAHSSECTCYFLMCCTGPHTHASCFSPPVYVRLLLPALCMDVQTPVPAVVPAYPPVCAYYFLLCYTDVRTPVSPIATAQLTVCASYFLLYCTDGRTPMLLR